MADQTRTSPDRLPPQQNRPGERDPAPCTCVPLRAETVEAAARLYTKVFVRDEPTTRWHRIIEENFLPFARTYVQFCENEGLSFLAREEKTGAVMGFIFCHDLTMDLESLGPEMQRYLSQFNATIQLMTELEEKYLDCVDLKPETILHVYQLGIGRQFRHRSIATVLIHHVIAFARERGFKKIVADCTGPPSSHSFGQCGFTRAGSIPYSSFRIGGTAFFDGLEGEICLMVKDL
ncbi:MAG: GNAT family N-acetyltransferase [Methanoregula sp.]|nr:GNAT family N-acetyltransferase [Methanoregula sp.]